MLAPFVTFKLAQNFVTPLNYMDQSSECIRPRKSYLDTLRFIAIISVVFLHTYQRIPIFAIPDYLFLPGVPIFLIISGGLIIPRATKCPPLQFYRKYWKRILQFVCLIPVCGIITNTLVWYCMGGSLTLRQANLIPSSADHISAGSISITEAFIKALTTGNGLYPNYFRVLDSHTWYLYLITLLYLLSPFIAIMFRKLGTRISLLLILIYFAGMFLIYTLKLDNSLKPFSTIASYAIYFPLGYFLIENLFAKGTLTQYTFFALGLLLLISNCLLPQDKAEWYLAASKHIIPPLISVGLTLICRDYLSSYCMGFYKKLRNGAKLFINLISQCAFGIYLWHLAILWVVSIYFPFQSPQKNPTLFLFYFSAGLFIPVIITKALGRTPFLRWLVS